VPFHRTFTVPPGSSSGFAVLLFCEASALPARIVPAASHFWAASCGGGAGSLNDLRARSSLTGAAARIHGVAARRSLAQVMLATSSKRRTAMKSKEEGGRVPAIGLSPFSFVRRLADDIDRFFEDFGERARPGWPTGGLAAGGEWEPVIEVEERNGTLVVRAEVPGAKREDLEVELDGDRLCISGERRDERQEQREGYFQTERRYGRFCRRLTLPQGVDAEKARANFADGVLEITIPAPEQGRGRRRIEVGGPDRPTGDKPGATTPSA
jgi:HSP20 family protein